MKKKVLSLFLVIAILISCVSTFSLSISALTVSDEGVLPFEDVQSNYWFADAAEFCYVNGVINGMNEYTFAPNGQLTRAQFVTMLANLEGVDLNMYSINKFTDVSRSHWYYGAVAWAYYNGVVSGTSEMKFSPNAYITRETLARIMTLYMQKKESSVTVQDNCLNKFIDKGSISAWAFDGMKYTVSAGLIGGMTDTTVAPRATVTRAQAARILMIYMDVYHYNCNHTYTNATCTESMRCTICGLKNGLPKGHSVSDGYSCKNTAVCLVCREVVSKSKNQHNFTVATCGKARTCKVCGVTRGEPTGKHNWWPATCTNPKMCKVCYKTEGKALGHKWQDASAVYCTNRLTCTRCGTESSSYGSVHNWNKATCTVPSKCVRCNKTSGTTAPHNWWAATCTNPKMCKVCYTTEGSALGHTTINGVCGRCNQNISVSMRELIGHPDECKTTSVFGFCYYKNFLDGIELCWGGENLTGKTINYYTITVYFYNAVGDPAYSELTGKNYKTVKYVGPVAPNQDLIIYSTVDYVPACSKVVIGEIKLEFSDGTEASGWYGYGTSRQNSAID